MVALLTGFGLVPLTVAQFSQTGAGPFDYNTTGNWTSGLINGVFSQTPSGASQQVTFATDTTLSTGLTFSLGGSSKSLTVLGSGANHTLTLGGDISVSGTTSGITLGAASPNMLDVNLGGADRTFTVATGNSLTFANSIAGSNAVTKAGAGTLTFNGANSYSGTTTVNAGTLSLGVNGALASGSNVVVASTAASTTANFSLASGVSQTIGTLTLGSASQTSSSISNVTVNSGATLTLGGTVTSIGTNGPTSAFRINGSSGTLALGGNRTFDVGDSAGNPNELLVFPTITGAGQSLTKIGAGRLQFEAANTYSGGTIVNAGSIWLNVSNGLPSGGNVNINGTTASTTTSVTLGNGYSQTIGALTFGGAGATATSTNTFAISASATLTLGGNVTYDATSNPSVASTITGSGTLALGGNRTFDIANSTANANEFTISAPISGSGQSLTKTGAGRLTLQGANTYDGGSIVNGGELFVFANNSVASTGGVTVNGTTPGVSASFWLGSNINQTIGALTFGGSGASSNSTNNVSLGTNSVLTLGGTVTYDATNNPLGANINTVGTLALGGDRIFAIANSTATTTELTISVPVSGSSQSLTKTGAGTLRLSGANTYGGGTVVSAGGLFVANTTGSGTGTGTVTVQSGAFLSGSGFISGATTIQSGGILGTGATSSTAGTLTFANGLTLNDGAVFDFRLGTTSDMIKLTGGTLTGATTAGSLTINLTAGTGFGAGNYTLFDFSTGGVTTSSFEVSDFTLGTTVSGYTYNLAMSGNTLQLTATASAIPEPSTYAAIFGAVSLVGAVVWRRRARRG